VAFDVYGPRDAIGRRHHVAILDDEGQLLFERLPEELGLVAAVCARLWEDFYSGPRVDGDELRQLAAELDAIGRAVADQRELLRLAAPDLEVYLTRTDILVRLGQLHALVDDALARGSGIECRSD
jgi:hypothetical protein